MNKIVINVRTGEKQIVPLTQAEIDEASARTAVEQFERVQQAEDAKDISKMDKRIAAICIDFGQQLGKTPEQVRSGIKALYDAL